MNTGLCQCGCKKKTKLAPQTCIAKGWTRGQPKKFRLGHNWRVQSNWNWGTHRMTYTPEYRAYSAAKARCNNPNHDKYEYYGGRGINFLFTSFIQFYSEVGPKPSPKHSLDRIKNHLHYQPGNVRWATQKEQIANSRRYKKAA